MIEVTAFLNRGSVYLAGEVVQCTINFLNSSSTSKGNLRGADTLAWASAQVHCQCTVQERGMINYKSQDVTAGASSGMTYFYPTKGEEGFTAFATEPKIIFCDLRLLPGESKTYVYQQQLPRDAIPSFRGRCVKYAYKITIGTQRPDSPIKLLRIPFRVLLVPGVDNLAAYSDKGSHDLKPSNPFLAIHGGDTSASDLSDQLTDAAVLDTALQTLALLTARRSPHHYNISTSKGKVGKFCIFKHSYKIGDDIIGMMDFTDASIPCLKFSVTLQSEEKVLQSHSTNSIRTGGASDTSAAAESNSSSSTADRLAAINLCHGSHEEVVLHARRTSFSLPVPITATPGFTTDVVQLKWHLHFEFISVSSPTISKVFVGSPTSEDMCTEAWHGRQEVDTETTEWDLPLKIYPTSPLLCSGTGSPSSSGASQESVLV